MITVFIKSLFLIFALSDQNKLIENENISVEYVFNLVEETKKKNRKDTPGDSQKLPETPRDTQRSPETLRDA